MQLFIVAAFIAACSAGRLEHLERSYLPPDNSGHGSFARSSFGSQPNTFGSFGSGGSKTSVFKSSSLKQYLPPDHEPSSSFNSFGSQGVFSQRTPSQQYGAPQFGSGSSFGSQFGRSQGQQSHGSQFGGSHGFGQNHGSHFDGQSHFQNSHDQFSQAPSSQYGAPQFGSASNGFGSSSAGLAGSGSFRSQGQFGAANRQYLAPKTSSSFQNIPQQSFDEETGYHY